MNTDRPRGPLASDRRGAVRPAQPANPSSQNEESGPFGNLGFLLQQALKEQDPDKDATATLTEETDVSKKDCADCWHAKVFRRDGLSMARCSLGLWVKPVITDEQLNSGSVRRWYADCPEYDDSE